MTGLYWFVVKSFRNAYIDFYRPSKLRGREFHFESDEEEESYQDLLLEMVAAESLNTADAQLEYADFLRVVKDGIKTLAPQPSAVLQLRLIKQLTPSEIMKKLKLSRSQVGQAYYRGLEQLKQYLRDRGYNIRKKRNS